MEEAIEKLLVRFGAPAWHEFGWRGLLGLGSAYCLLLLIVNVSRLVLERARDIAALQETRERVFGLVVGWSKP